MFRFNKINSQNKNQNKDRIYLMSEEEQEIMKENAKLNKMGAKQDDLKSIFLYELQLYYGFGVPVNKKKAAKYFKKAADRGHQLAIKNYAMMLYNGD